MDDMAPMVAALVRDMIDVAIGQVADFCREGPDRTTDNHARAAKEYFQAARAGLSQIDMLLKLAKQVAPPAPTDDRPDPAAERARILGYIEDAERRVAEHRRTHSAPEGEGGHGADASLALRQAQGEGCGEGPSSAPAPASPVGLTLSLSKGEADPPPDPGAGASLPLRQAQGEGCGEGPSSAPAPASPVGLTLSPSKGEADPPPDADKDRPP